MYLDRFIGSENIRHTLGAAIANRALSHGILLCAEEGMGVNYFAQLLAADIVGAESLADIASEAHPSVQIIRGEGAQGIIRVDKIRQINDNVNFSSLAGEKRVVIIENCENFNLNSANALLKNLEEPKDDITYILTTTSRQKILATIRSRCGVYTLAAPTSQQIRDYFIAQGADMAAVDRLEKIYGGNIGKINNALTSPKRYDILAARISVYQSAGQNDVYAIAKTCYAYNRDREGFKTLLSDLTRLCHNNLSQKNVQLIELVQKYSEILSFNTNMNLVIENFAIERAK